MSKIMRIKAVIIGVGAPNETRANGKTMCAIMLTNELGLIRVYPIPAGNTFPVWGIVNIKIEKGGDPRDESYKLLEYELTGKIECKDQKRELLNASCLKSGMDDPMVYQNTLKKSIFLVKPSWGDVEVTLSQKIPDIAPDDEECGWIVTQGKHWLKPYLKWTSDQGKEHTSHLGGREIYEGLRNNPHQPWEMMNNIQIMNPDYEHWMLMGNMKDKRNVWLCVHLHRLKKSTNGSTPLFLHPIIGNDTAWPYSDQKTSNVEIVDGHPTLFTMKNMTNQNYLGNTILAK